jgi:hypothetical protein
MHSKTLLPSHASSLTTLGRHGARWLSLATLALGLGASLATASHGDRHGRSYRNDVSVSGRVEVVKEIPGGTVQVGVEIGNRRPDVVVVQRPTERPREVVVVERRPEPEVIVIEKRRPQKRVVVVERRDRCDRNGDWRHEGYRRERERAFRAARCANTHISDNGDSFTFSRQDGGSREHYFRDGHQVSYDYEGPDGRYHYFENREMVSIDDNRGGENQHVYYKK